MPDTYIGVCWCEPFTVGPNTFCIIQPLCTLAGEFVTPDQFPNRGLIWWLVFDPHRPLARQGQAVVVNTVNAIAYQADDPKKDRFQVDVNETIRAVEGKDLFEVIDLTGIVADEEALLRVEHVDLGFQPMPISAVALGDSVYGLFRCTRTSLEDHRISLHPTDAAKWKVWKVPAADFFKDVAAHPVEVGQEPLRRRRAFVLPKELNVSRAAFEAARKLTLLDALPESHVLSWGLKLLAVPKKTQQTIRETLEKAESFATMGDGAADEARAERFRGLLSSGLQTGEKAAQVEAALEQSDTFRELRDRLLATAERDHVGKHAGELRAQAEKELAELWGQREQAKNEIETARRRAEQEHNRRLHELESDFGKKKEEFEQSLKAEREALDRRRSEIESREAGIRSLLEDAARKFDTGRQALMSEFLALAPMFQATFGGTIRGAALPSAAAGGTAAAPGAPDPAGEKGEPAAFPFPAFLEKPRPDAPVKEGEFLDRLDEGVRKAGFRIPRFHLVNFHVSVLTCSLNLLAGPPGTGKSRLPEIYAAALGVSDEFLHVPVKPNWTDDRDLLGFFNSLTGLFEPAPSGFAAWLAAAFEDRRRGRGGIYLACIDEMNLARPEYYLSTFLSVLQRDETDRWLELFPEHLGRPGDPWRSMARVQLGTNLRFVGTVNVDETTHFFSPKVLDRVNVILLPRPDLKNLPPRTAGGDVRKAFAGVRPVNATAWLSWNKPPSPVADPVLEKINQALQKASSVVGYRVRDDIARWVGNAEGLLPTHDAVDLQVLQRVLPRLRGGSEKFKKALEEVRHALPSDRFPRSHAHLTRMIEAEFEADFFQG